MKPAYRVATLCIGVLLILAGLLIIVTSPLNHTVEKEAAPTHTVGTLSDLAKHTYPLTDKINVIAPPIHPENAVNIDTDNYINIDYWTKQPAHETKYHEYRCDVMVEVNKHVYCFSHKEFSTLIETQPSNIFIFLKQVNGDFAK